MLHTTLCQTRGVSTTVTVNDDSLNEDVAGALAPPAHLTRMTQIRDPPNSTDKRLMVNPRHCGIAGDRWNLDEGGGPELGQAARRHQPNC